MKPEVVVQSNPQVERIPEPLRTAVAQLTEEWESGGKVGRLWAGDETLWTSSGESQWLGWLWVIDDQLADIERLLEFQSSLEGRISHAVLAGMGGSSLCPEVLRLCCGVRGNFPRLRVIDSTDPAQIVACERSIRLESSLILSASKSGSTLETSLITEYFLDRLQCISGAQRASWQFAAITDPGSALERTAAERGYPSVAYGAPSVGGRYSALSAFGMAPAATIGLDPRALLESADRMREACSPESSAASNPGLRLGLLLGAAALAGRDKLTFVPSPRLASLGTWIEQLIAESTGKRGKGIVPIEDEALVAPSWYGDDRLFVEFSLESEGDPEREAALDELSRSGHPVVHIRVRSLEDIGQEFFRWEFATAVAGSVLGINPFDQPDVESSKVAARRLTAAYERDGTLPSAEPFYADSRFRLFASSSHARRLTGGSRSATLPEILAAHLATAEEGDYIALLAFIRRDAVTAAALGYIRAALRLSGRNATCAGFGPRYLHSTGQLHKGGPDKGVFLQIGCDDGPDLAVPGRDLTFGVVKAAQALGDFDVLCKMGRRALRIQIDGDLISGLTELGAAAVQASQ